MSAGVRLAVERLVAEHERRGLSLSPTRCEQWIDDLVARPPSDGFGAALDRVRALPIEETK